MTPAEQRPVAAGQDVPDRFPMCLPWILKREGGYTNNPADRGGATNRGITQATLAAWRGRPVTTDDVRDLGAAEVAAIYRKNYWEAAHCQDCPPGVDLTMFDIAVMSGPGKAVKMLQECVGVPADGAFGPMTRRAVASTDSKDLIYELGESRESFYRGIARNDVSQRVFLEGWVARVNLTEAEAQKAAQ